MIRIAAMLDADNMIGSSDPADDEWRMAQLPTALPAVMDRLYQAENVVAGAASAGPISGGGRPGRCYVLARDPSVQVAGCITVTDPQVLVDRYRDSDDELLVIGGLRVFDIFTPHARVIEIARSDGPLPGELVYDAWESEPLELVGETPWSGGRTLRYERQGPG